MNKFSCVIDDGVNSAITSCFFNGIVFSIAASFRLTKQITLDLNCIGNLGKIFNESEFSKIRTVLRLGVSKNDSRRLRFAPLFIIAKKSKRTFEFGIY